MISNSRTAHRVRQWSACVGLAGGAAVTAGMIGLAVAPSALADDTTVDVNGWTVQTDGSDVSPATLIDPSDSLGNGTQVTGSLDSVPYASDQSESVQIFDSSTFDTDTPPFLGIRDEWLSPSLLESMIQANDGTTGNVTEGFLTTNLGGNEVVDLLNVQPNSPSLAVAYDPSVPLVNPDATGPIDVGGLALASPQDGALFNDIFDAAFNGDTADWANAATLFGDLFSL
jgi:hypothetical protein